MKNINWNQIKSDNFNILTVVEDSVEIDSNNLDRSKRKMDSSIEDLTSLKEALMFKKARLTKKVEESNSNDHVKLIERMQEKMRTIRIDSLGDSKEIVEKNNEIIELKLIQKIFRYSLELDENEEQVLNLLYKSELKEDWEFLCILLSVILKYSKTRDMEIFIKYSKMIEIKIVDLFKESQKSELFSVCKSCVFSLQKLDKEIILFDTFIYALAPFNRAVNVQPINDKTAIVIEETTDVGGDSFHKFIQEVNSFINTKLETGKYLFGTDNKFFQNYICDKLFDTMISKAVSLYLNVSNSYLFLTGLKVAYNEVSQICISLNLLFKNIKTGGFISDVFGEFISLALQKERDVLDELFEILVYGKQSQNKYTLFDNTIKKEENNLKIFENVLAFLFYFERRSALFYSKEEETDIIRYYIRKSYKLIDRVILASKDKYEAIDILSKFYLMTKKILNHKFYLVSESVQLLSNAISDNFKSLVKESKEEIKFKVSKVYFTSQNAHSDLLNYIKEIIKKSEIFQGQNHNVFADKILYHLYLMLFKQIFSIVYNKEQSPILINMLDDFIGYILFINRTTIFGYFSYLKNLALLITVNADDFMQKYIELQGQIQDKDLRALLKCRKDRDEIKNILAKNRSV